MAPKVGKMDLTNGSHKDPLQDRWSRHELRARLSHDRSRDNRHSLMRASGRPNIYNGRMIHNGSIPALSSALCTNSGRRRKVFGTQSMRSYRVVQAHRVQERILSPFSKFYRANVGTFPDFVNAEGLHGDRDSLLSESELTSTWLSEHLSLALLSHFLRNATVKAQKLKHSMKSMKSGIII